VAGTLHQGILWLFEDDPWLAFDALGIARPVDGTPIDRRTEVERDAPPTDTTDARFKIHSYLPDLVLVYRDPTRPDIGVVINIEAQSKPDYRKRWRIPVCQAVLADKHQLETWSVVVALSLQAANEVRSWATGPPPKVDALVLAIDNVPRVTSLEQARLRPTMTALSAALHGCEGDLECVRVAIAVFRDLPERPRRRYTLTVLAALPEREFELIRAEQQDMEEQDELWDIEKRSGLYAFMRRRLSEQWRNEGRDEGRDEGRKVTLVEMIFALLEVRGLAVDEATTTRVRACEELGQLEHWARRAREVLSVTELFTSD
jgi:hypothetical protein